MNYYDWSTGDTWSMDDSGNIDWLDTLTGSSGDDGGALDYSYQDWMGGDSGSSDAGSSWWSSVFGGGDTSSGDNGNIWGSLLNAAGQYAMYEGKKKDAEKLSEKQLENALAIMAEKEKYYQLHGQQLADAYSNYAQYNTAPVNPFGLLAQGGGFGTSGGFGNG